MRAMHLIPLIVVFVSGFVLSFVVQEKPTMDPVTIDGATLLFLIVGIFIGCIVQIGWIKFCDWRGW